MLGTDHNGAEGDFRTISHIPETVCSSPMEDVCRNVAKRMASNLPRLHKMPDYGKYKGRPLAIVSGGPSLNDTLDELSEIKTIMVCGSTHDHLISLGFKPDYAVICDSAPEAAHYVRKPLRSCKYLVASGCDDAVFDVLDGYDVTLWHSAGIAVEYFKGEPIIQGGSTTTLRALNVAIMLGFLDQHFFGFDSSFPDTKQHHAYPHHDPVNPFPVKVGNKRIFQSDIFGLVQAIHFQEQLNRTGFLFTPTIHGDGMIAEIVKQRSQNGLQSAKLCA